MKKTHFLVSLITSLCTPAAIAGGLIAYEIGTPDLGLASAGYAARAQDAATAVTNPAGMIRLKDSQLMMGGQMLYGNVEFDANPDSTANGGNGGNALGWFPGGGLYYVYNAGWCVKYGLSLYGNFGGVLDYDDDWIGRYFVKKSSLLGFTTAPSIAWQFDRKWSFGAALNIMYGYYSDSAAINNNPLGRGNTPDGQFKFRDTTWSLGATLGLLYELSDNVRFGLTYTTKNELNFSKKLEFTNTLPAIIPGGSFNVPLDLSMNVPQSIMASFFQQLNGRWALLGNVSWQNWSEFGKVDVVVNSPNPAGFTVDANYKDTWHVALGSQYRSNDHWRLSFGMAYDSSMMSDEARTASLVSGPAWRFGLGAQYLECRNWDIGFGYTLLWNGNLPLDQTGGVLNRRLAGSYDDTYIHYFGANMTWHKK